MLSFDQAENEFFTAKNKMEILQQQIYQEQSLLRGEKNRVLDDLENLKDERNAAVISIEPESLKLYEALRKQKRGVAIVRMINKTCSACGSTLSSSSSQSAQIVNQLTRCETCGRFLYGGLE
jgi:predicted  nucleic acid-binding Zn-ribbon protein